ncbi:MAG: adenosine kinase [Flavobacteriales bacterium]|nr:adenosine kinase [Flavobacteriales bacterium]
MQSIKLTGIGNALVDMEFNITEAELHGFGVRKGGMTLTNVQRQREILETLASKTPHRSSGGSVANSMIAFAQFGGTAGFMSVLGADATGEFYANEFRDLTIELAAEVIPGADTGSCVVMITPDGERTMNTTLAANTLYSRDLLDSRILQASEWLLLEGYKVTEESGAEALDVAAYTAVKNGSHVALSCSDAFIIESFADRLKPILKNTDLVICNQFEAQALAAEETAEASFRALKHSFRNVVLTKGSAGSLIHWFGTDAEIPAYHANVVDVTGAGDMYAGAFMYAVLHGYKPEHAGRLASYAASRIVQQYGARLRTDHVQIRDTILNQATIHGV